MLIGPTGVGKTYLVETIANLLAVPFVIGDATTFTEAGYVGEDVDHVLALLYQRAIMIWNGQNGGLYLSMRSIRSAVLGRAVLLDAMFPVKAFSRRF